MSNTHVANRGTRIDLCEVTKRYGQGAPAVDRISLTIEPGEFMTLLGPSGSGKTTTLNMIAGFEALSDGSITFDGADVGGLPPHKRNLGMLFQNYALFPHMTVAQNIAYPLQERRMGKDQIGRKVAEAVDLVQLRGKEDQYPSQLSGGQQQRVALARAIVFSPTALLLDEPLGALDRNLRSALQLEIRRIHRELGTTFVFVTHDQEEAMNLSDRIALFDQGRIAQVGSPEQLYHQPDTLFTARFLGDSNVFPVPGLTPAERSLRAGDLTWSVVPGTVSTAPGVATDAAVVVRPEDIRIGEPPASSEVNSLAGVIRDVEYMGSYRTLLVEWDRFEVGGRVKVDALSDDLRPGERIDAWWPAERQRIVAA